MGCGCLTKNKVEILSKIKEENDLYDIPLIINRNPNNILDNNNQNGRDNHNNIINENNINNSQNNNNKNPGEIQSIQINVRQIQISDNSPNNNSSNLNNNINNNNNNINNNMENMINEIPEENNFSIDPAYEPYLQSKHDENFNYKEVENEYVGEGIKRMKGYISPVPYEELLKIREEFWSSRIEGNKVIWEVLHMICNDNLMSIDDIDGFMKSSNIVTYKGCINVTYDSRGFLYEIPNYCINNPIEYEKKEEEIKKIPKKQNIEIKIRCYTDEGKIKISNYENIENLKKIIFSGNDFKNKYMLDGARLFFGGKELQNQKQLWFYNIENKSIVQMLAKQIEKKQKNDMIIISKKQNLKSKDINEEEDNQNNECIDNLQETVTEQNKFLVISNNNK